MLRSGAQNYGRALVHRFGSCLPPPIVHFAFTWCHSCDECSQAFPVFHWSSAHMHSQTEGGDLGTRLLGVKILIIHIQCLLRVDGSILAGVFLTSSFCVVPESSYIFLQCSLLVAWYLNCSIAASSTKSTVASFKNFHTRRDSHKIWRLFSSVDHYTLI